MSFIWEFDDFAARSSPPAAEHKPGRPTSGEGAVRLWRDRLRLLNARTAHLLFRDAPLLLWLARRVL